MRTIIAVVLLLTVSLAFSQDVIRDKIDLPFINDPEVLGEWQCIDLVRNISDFSPGKRWFKENIDLQELTFLENGKTPKVWQTWTKGVLMDSNDQTASHYEIRDVDGHRYMFLEWKSGDYTIRHMKPMLCVLKKK